MPELNHSDKWAPLPEVGAALQGAGVTVEFVESPDRWLVSGDLAAFARACDAPVLRLARDRALVLGQTGLAPDWHDGGFALSDLSAGLALVRLSGANLSMLTAKASTSDAMNPGPSKAITFAGVPVVVDPRDGALDLHVERGLLAYLWTWLSAALAEPAQ